jgi:DNA-binding SARP family transcriptional activator/predicted ATPase
MEDGLQLTLLGKPAVSQGSVPVTGLVYEKSLALLCYLALTGRPHSRAALAGLLWGEATEANARGALRKSIADLRQRVAPHLTITRGQVAFDRTRPHWVDVEVFERRVSEAMGTIQREGALSSVDAARLAGAVDLYQDDFLAGFYVRHAPAFEEWVLLTRERLRLSMLRALHALATHYAAQGAYSEGIVYTERLLTMAPEQDEAHRQMMSLLALSGQQGAALRQYQNCHRVLKEELGVEPEEETTALYIRIRDGVELEAPSLALRHNLPIPPLPLIGRKEQLANIQARLQDPACRQITLLGPGGSGKTHLALVAAAALLTQDKTAAFPDGGFFVPLAPLESVEAMVPAVAQCLGFNFYDEHEPRQQLLNYLRKKRLLLVLDNFEHLLDGVALVADILETAPGIKVLATSRARLELRGEQLFPVAGVDCPQQMTKDLNVLRSFAAVELFLESGRRIRPDLELTVDDLPNVARICCLVEGLPLGILLAASWIRILTPADIADRLSGEPGPDVYGSGQGLDILETDWRDVPARQRSMRAVFDHSWNLLTQREQMVFAALSVFRGGFSLQAACQVSGGSLRQLMALVDQSLVQRAGPGRYAIHELLRHYAGEKLGGKPEPLTPLRADQPAAAADLRSQVRDRHSAFFCAALQAWAADLKGARQQAALAQMEVDIANARAAWDWAVERGQVTQMAQAMDGLGHFYRSHGRYEEGARLCRTAVEQLSRTEPPSGVSIDELRLTVAKALAWQAAFSSLLGRSDLAQTLARQSLILLEELVEAEQEPASSLLKAVRREKAFATWRLGRAMFDVDRAQTRPLYEQSLAMYQILNDRWGMANVLEDLGWMARYEGDYDRARLLGEEDLVLRRALDDQRGVSRSLRQLSAIAYRQGRLEEAESLIRESCAIPLAKESQAEQANRLSGSGWILAMLGQFLEGHSWLEDSVSIWDNLGVSNMVAYMSVPLGFAKMHLGQYAEAGALAQAGLEAARQADDVGRTGFSRLILGWMALAKREYGEALACLQESAALSRAVVAEDQVGETLALLGYAARGLDESEQARRYLCEALRIAAELGAFLPVMFALPAVALLRADRGELEGAVELYRLASRYPFVANSRWFEDVAGRRIATVAASLPPEVVAAALERGLKGDLQATAAELMAELAG